MFSYPDDFDEVHMLAKGKKHRKADLNQDEKYCINEFRKFYMSHVTIPELLPTEFRTPDVSISTSSN